MARLRALSSVKLVPITIQDAKIFVARHHRHHAPPLYDEWALVATIDAQEKK